RASVSAAASSRSTTCVTSTSATQGTRSWCPCKVPNATSRARRRRASDYVRAVRDGLRADRKEPARRKDVLRLCADPPGRPGDDLHPPSDSAAVREIDIARVAAAHRMPKLHHGRGPVVAGGAGAIAAAAGIGHQAIGLAAVACHDPVAEEIRSVV